MLAIEEFGREILCLMSNLNFSSKMARSLVQWSCQSIFFSANGRFNVKTDSDEEKFTTFEKLVVHEIAFSPRIAGSLLRA